MRSYGKYLALNRNARGCYIIDTVVGCALGLENNSRGCYGECYAAKFANQYGYDFSNTTIRAIKPDSTTQLFLPGFKDVKHLYKINNQIEKCDMPFIRIGHMGDPSFSWSHTIAMCEKLSLSDKPIVIVTKHWNDIPDELMSKIEKLNVCINTSISALDSNEQILHRLYEFYRLKNACSSVLRIVSCDFNKSNARGLELSKIQGKLFEHKPNIDTILRVRSNNPLVAKEIVNIKKTRFLSSYCNASVFNNNTYFGYCGNCPDMCGVNL